MPNSLACESAKGMCPMVNQLQGGVMMKNLMYATVLCILPLMVGCACCKPASQPTCSPKLVVVKGSVNTTVNNGPAGQGVNIDAVSRAALPFDKVKRYTVSIQTALLSTAPAGVDRIEVYVGVLEGGSSYDVRVLQQDPVTASPFPHPGITVLPYAGTNSYIKVFRGADGLGPVDVRFNAYVEVEP